MTNIATINKDYFVDNEILIDALKDICFRIGQLKNNVLSESTYNQIDELEKNVKELVKNIKNE